MLPTLSKQEGMGRLGESLRLYEPPQQLSQNLFSRKESMREDRKSRLKMAGGFRAVSKDQMRQRNVQPNNKLILQQPSSFPRTNHSNDVAREIRRIQIKIKLCERKIQQDKLRKINHQSKPLQAQQLHQNFLRLVREQQIQEQENRFDYLTNPVHREKQTVQEIVPIVEEKKIFSIQEGVEKLQKFYQGSLKKKFQRREIQPHQPCKRKVPKLSITKEQNALLKTGKPADEGQHLFRVLTKEVTPQQIYPTIPSFNVIKDNLSKNIVAYLAQYKPFIDKTKEKQLQKNKDGQDIESDKAKRQEEPTPKLDENLNKSSQIVIFE